MVHPEKVVVGGMVNAVGSVELQAEDGHPYKVEKDGVVGAAADASVGQIRISNVEIGDCS